MTKLYDKFYDRQNEALDKFIIYTNDLFDRAGKLEDTDMGIFLQTRINDILETNSVYDTQAANNPDLELEYAKNEAVPSMQRSLSELQQLEIENPALRDYDTGRNRTLAEGAVRRYDEATDAIIKNRDAFRQRSYQQEASMTYTSPATG